MLSMNEETICFVSSDARTLANETHEQNKAIQEHHFSLNEFKSVR